MKITCFQIPCKFHAIKPLGEHTHSISKSYWCFLLNVSKFQPPVASPLCSRLALVLPQTLFHFAACLPSLRPAEPGCSPLPPSLTHSPLPCVKTTRYAFFVSSSFDIFLSCYFMTCYTISSHVSVPFLTCPILFLLLIFDISYKEVCLLKKHIPY